MKNQETLDSYFVNGTGGWLNNMTNKLKSEIWTIGCQLSYIKLKRLLRDLRVLGSIPTGVVDTYYSGMSHRRNSYLVLPGFLWLNLHKSLLAKNNYSPRILLFEKGLTQIQLLRCYGWYYWNSTENDKLTIKLSIIYFVVAGTFWFF